MSTHPYRTPAVRSPRPWLVRLDRYLPLRGCRWYRRAVGGAWLNLWAYLMPSGGCEFWHHEGVDPPVHLSTKIMERELWP